MDWQSAVPPWLDRGLTAVWPVLSFFLGASVAFALQYVAYRFNQRREYWIRRLNSYQDFCRHSAQLIDLLIADIEVPADQRWSAVDDARKAAYDAEFYDPDAVERWTEMQKITIEMAALAANAPRDSRALKELAQRIAAFRNDAQRRDARLRRRIRRSACSTQLSGPE